MFNWTFRCFSVEQLTCALCTKVFKVPHFQLLSTNECQFIYKSVHVFFLYAVVSIFLGFRMLIYLGMNGIVFFNLDSIYIINKPLHLESFLDPKVHLRCHKHFLFSLFYFVTNLLSLNSKFLFSKLLCQLYLT